MFKRSACAQFRWRKRVINRRLANRPTYNQDNLIHSYSEQSNHFNDHLFEIDSESHQSDNLSFQVDNELSIHSRDHPFQLNNSSTQFDVLNQPQLSKSKALNDEILKRITLLHREKKMNNSSIDEMLKIINIITENQDVKFDLPKSFHHFKNTIDLKLERYYGFTCPYCNSKQEAKQRTSKKFECSNCIKSFSHLAISNQEYFFHFNLSEIIGHLLNKFAVTKPVFSNNSSIDSIYDTSRYKNYHNLMNNDEFLMITVFIDG